MSAMLTLGIDPGLSGAVGLLDADGMPELVARRPHERPAAAFCSTRGNAP